MRTHNWQGFGSSDEIIEIIVRDCSGAKIESFKFNVKDKEKTKSIMNILKRKYNLNISYLESKDRDIDWLSNDSNFF